MTYSQKLHKGTVPKTCDPGTTAQTQKLDVALSNPNDFVAAPKNSAVLDAYNKYELWEVPQINADGVLTSEMTEYIQFLKSAFTAVGIWDDKFRPEDTSRCYRVTHQRNTVAIFRLTPAKNKYGSNLTRAISSSEDTKVDSKTVLEVNNVAVDSDFQGDLLLGFIMRACATLSADSGYKYVAGYVRHDILPLFTDFGAIPVSSFSTRILNRSDIEDFVIYFNTSHPDHVAYARQRAYHYFHRKVVMQEVRKLTETARQ